MILQLAVGDKITAEDLTHDPVRLEGIFTFEGRIHTYVAQQARVKVNGTEFCSTWIVQGDTKTTYREPDGGEYVTVKNLDPSLADWRREEAVENLLRFVNEIVLFGCGGLNHRFDGDVTAHPALECVKCGTVRPDGWDLTRAGWGAKEAESPDYWRAA